MATTETLPRPPCPWTFQGAPLSCDTLDAPTTIRVHYELRPAKTDTYTEICIARLGGSYPGKVQSLPTCAEHDSAVASAWSILGHPAPAASSDSIRVAVGRDQPNAVATGTAIGAASGPMSSGRKIETSSGSDEISTPEIQSPGPTAIPLPETGALLLIALLALAFWMNFWKMISIDHIRASDAARPRRGHGV